tara:strand:- start:195 stop:704 length:510 start_codon:yes stop_codon:yes gene_type:complete
MLGAKFFYDYFKYNKNIGHKIQKYNSNEEFDLQNQISIEIIEIDKQISENSKALLEAQIVKLRSTFSKSNNFLEKIGENIYKTKLEDSISWHQSKLKELFLKRKELQINLEKIKGIFWLSRIKRFLIIVLIGFLILLSLFIFLSGFMIIIYLLPLIIFIVLAYLIIAKK